MQKYVNGYTEYYIDSCTQITSGTWTVDTNPKYGVVSFGTVTKKLCNGSCPNNTFSFAAIYYTWTSNDSTVKTDSFTATWRGQSTSQQSIYSIVNISCGDERDKLIAEYETQVVQNVINKKRFIPVCSNFTQSASSKNYSFSDFKSPDYSWALIKKSLVISASKGYGLNAWTGLIGKVHKINSAFRNPVRNANTKGASWRSRHMFGDAVDLKNITRSDKEHDLLKQAAHSAGADYVEPLTGPCKKGCVHAEWRNRGYAK